MTKIWWLKLGDLNFVTKILKQKSCDTQILWLNFCDTQIVTKFKKSNCYRTQKKNQTDKTQKIKLWQLKKSNCDKNLDIKLWQQ